MMAIASKRDYVRRQLDRQNSDPDQDKKLYINYTSGASAGAYPYSVAGGCAAQICTSQGVNEFLLTYLNQVTGTHAPVVRTGVVVMDFPGGALIDKIVGYNFFNPGTGSTVSSSDSTRKADSFLLNAIDQYGSSDALRVPQSYTGGFFGPGGKFGPTGYQASFTYDNAVTVMALLTNHTGTDFTHAIALGDSLLYAQDHDPVNDGRIRASYLPTPFITTLGRDYPVGTPYIGGWSVYTGNMAWAGMAFCHLYKATGDSRYLNGALRAVNWIQANSADDRGAGGYADTSEAEDGSGLVKRTWKATEHNIDVGAFFAMLHQLTGDQTWRNRSDNAFAFVRTMQAPNKSLWTGTGLDGVTTNEDGPRGRPDLELPGHPGPDLLPLGRLRRRPHGRHRRRLHRRQFQRRRHQWRLVRGHRPPPGRLPGPQGPRRRRVRTRAARAAGEAVGAANAQCRSVAARRLFSISPVAFRLAVQGRSPYLPST
uniref:Uncharacterized protein n=1 Tax=Streptomyces sp. NBC_01393 TaxID=2903851 RepID=A0AAU3IGR2_9ACTN